MYHSDQELRDLGSHFPFGENWSDFSETIDKEKIEEARSSIARLLGSHSLTGRTFLDVGSGSGIHSLAALSMGCSRVLAIDLDPQSVATTEATLEAYSRSSDWDCSHISVFELDPVEHGTFDIVYSWGVLHHTGAMYKAIRKCATMVGHRGLLAIALYRKTPLCGFWRWEKRLYKNSSPRTQQLLRSSYIGAFRLACMATGRDFRTYVREYKQNRGMSFDHDVHDWMGGYPYESITRDEATRFVEALKFDSVRSFTKSPGLGLFGSGNDEYVFRRNSSLN